MLKLLMLLGKANRYIYFLFWKRRTHQQIIDNKDGKLKKAKKMAKVLNGGKNLIVPISRSQAPMLRLAFDKLMKPKTDLVRRMILAVGHNHERAFKSALCLWKFLTFKAAMEKGMEVLRKRPRVVDGTMMLDKVHKRRPRHALRCMNRNAKHHDRLADAIKKLLLINRVDLQRAFDKWAGKDNFPSRF
jgi:hypothetical protein